VDDLVKQVVERTGISEEQARQAVQVVLGFVKDRLPGPIAAHVDQLVGGQGQSAGGAGGLDIGNLGNMLGGMFGGEHN